MPVPNVIQQLFQPAAFDPAAIQTVTKGSIITFRYVGQQRDYAVRDRYPAIIVSDPAGYVDRRTGKVHPDIVRGVNIHYLTLPSLREMLFNYANPGFSYASIRGNVEFVRAYRSYKRNGIDTSTLRMLDVEFLKNLSRVLPSLELNEVEQMRAQIREMIENPEIVQPPAAPGPQLG